MVKRILVLVVILLSTLAFNGCTRNQMARQWGGNSTINLPKGKKLMNFTWKEGNDLWYLTRDMNENDTAETYQFSEDSSLGILEGNVTIVEHK